MKKIMTLAAILLVSSCATHPLMKGTVALKVDEKIGVACIETKNLQVGSTLTVMNNNCDRIPSKKNDPYYCQLKSVGDIEVTKILNEHYSEFRTLTDFKFQEGSILKLTK